MKRSSTLCVLSLVLRRSPFLLALVSAAAIAAETPKLDWRLPKCARIEDNILIVDVPKGDPDTGVEAHAHCEAEVNLSPFLAGGRGAVMRVRARARDISKPDRNWNGVKCMLRYIAEEDGNKAWPGWQFPVGTFDWRTAEVHVNWLNAKGLPRDGLATIVLGLQGCTGHAEFDLSTLRLESEDLGISLANDDYIVRYPADAGEAGGGAPPGRCPLRGTMLPGRNTTEDDVETLHWWGATLVRFQITRNWHKVNDNQDLDEYARWVDRRLDNLENVLRWCGERGMKVCVDLHALPGGKWGEREGQPLEMNMFSDDRYADAFIETWRRIATRFRGHPALYGYDLVNEPTQQRPVKNNYWDLQRRAAEAVREIDPDTPIVFAANLASKAPAFRYLRPLAMDNVIYQAHVYLPGSFTHQGVNSHSRSTPERPLTWPGSDPVTGETWNKDWLRKALQPIRDFQLRHQCRIYVGEFSAAAWAPGAENYLRDCISLFEEYGWDWTYHAFRESPVWDVEMEGADYPSMRPASDTPRKSALLNGFAGRIAAAPVNRDSAPPSGSVAAP